jgi:drug/metabolite transporter (DMT)-like permease
MSAAPLTTAAPARLASWLPGYLALAAIWGSSFLFIKVGVRELHPLYLTLARASIGALTVLLLVAVMRHRLPRDVKVWGHLFVTGLLGVTLPFTLFGFGEERISSVLAGIWNATTPLLVLPIAVLVFRTERLTVRRGVGLVLGFVGVLVILGVWHGADGSSLVGQVMCLGAAACYGVAIPYQRKFLSGRPEPGVALVAGQLLMAVLQLAVLAPLFAGALPAPASLSLGVVLSALALGALGTGVAFAINFRIIRLAGASTSASVTYLLPIVATIIGVVVLNEGLSWYQPVGAAVVLLGVAISQGGLARRRARTPVPASRPVRAAELVAARPIDPVGRPGVDDPFRLRPQCRTLAAVRRDRCGVRVSVHGGRRSHARSARDAGGSGRSGRG